MKSNCRSGRHGREQSLSRNSIRSATPCASAFSRATARAAGLMSMAVTRQSGRCLADADGDDAAARAHVGDGRRLLRPADPAYLARSSANQPDHEQLGLRPGDQHVGRDPERERVELATAHQIGHRRAFGPAADQPRKAARDCLAGHARRRCVEFDPLAAQGMGQQDFGIQPRAVRTVRLDSRSSIAAGGRRSRLRRVDIGRPRSITTVSHWCLVIGY